MGQPSFGKRNLISRLDIIPKTCRAFRYDGKENTGSEKQTFLPALLLSFLLFEFWNFKHREKREIERERERL